MACIVPAKSQEAAVLYPHVLKTVRELVEGEPNWVASAANAAAAIGFLVKDLNWVGVYLCTDKEDELLLGPFWGKPAVTRIAFGKGVCGDAAQSEKTLVVKDVHQYPGHIACDLYSNSEIVIPLHKDGKLIGVLDIDSPLLERFDDSDREHLERIAAYIAEAVNFPMP